MKKFNKIQEEKIIKKLLKERKLLQEQDSDYVWENSGCLDPDDPNFCSTCEYDCVGEPHSGVVTGAFGWNWSSGNDDLGHTCCCQYDSQYNPTGEPQPSNSNSECCYTNTNPGGTYTTDNFGGQDSSYYYTCEFWTDDYYWWSPNNPNYEQNVIDNSGCLDPDDPLFCPDCLYDCVNEPHSGVQTGAFGWNWSEGNDDLGHTCCCQNSGEYNPTGQASWGNVTSACCYPNTNIGGDYVPSDESICEPEPEEGDGDYEGCLDPVAANFNPNATSDCLGEWGGSGYGWSQDINPWGGDTGEGDPTGGVNTGLFGWNWSTGNDYFGNQCCCDYGNGSDPSPTANTQAEAWNCNGYQAYLIGQDEFWNNYLFGSHSDCRTFNDMPIESQIHECDRFFNQSLVNDPLSSTGQYNDTPAELWPTYSLNSDTFQSWPLGTSGGIGQTLNHWIIFEVQPWFDIGTDSAAAITNGGMCCFKIGEIIDDTWQVLDGMLDVYGCMDSTATNYNPDANVDDGSCEYEDDGGNTFVDPGKAPFADKPKKTPIEKPMMQQKIDKIQPDKPLNESIKRRFQKLAGIRKKK